MNLPVSISNKNILIAGAGGGFDVFAGLPIGLELQKANNKVFYANYSFTNLEKVTNAEWVISGCLKISHASSLSEGSYFPEKHLAAWLEKQKSDSPEIYCFPHLGVKNLKDTYAFLIDLLKIDCLLIVDGGCDGIFRGDEFDLGTPSMDSISIIAGSLQNIKEKYYVLTAFGSEGVGKEVSHYEALQRMSELAKAEKFAGTCSLVRQDPLTKQFDDCIQYTYSQLDANKQSNILSSIRASYNGSFGDTVVTQKVEFSPIWISLLTSIYWFFDLDAVAKMKLFYHNVLETTNVMMVAQEIEKVRPNKPENKPIIPI